MEAAAGSMSVRRDRAGSWPPAADRVGMELSVPAVLAILVIGWLLLLVVFAAAGPGLGLGLTPPTPTDSPVRLVVGQLLVPSAVTVVMSLGIVFLLGWHRVVGLGIGTASRWGIVPLAALVVATVVTLRLPEVAEEGPRFIGSFLLGLLLAALAEEILFRGFLLHGLTRQIGGRRAVLVGSLLFAAAHIPALAVQRQLNPLTLVGLFGFGVLMCRVRSATGSIWWPTGIHTLSNFVIIAVLESGRPLEDDPVVVLGLLQFVLIVMGVVIGVRLLARRPDPKRPAAPMIVFTTQPVLALLPPPPPPLRTQA
jgi:membrane protease YdiL (CAAX protease family)